MLRRTERTLENLPVGPLGFIPITGCEELGKNVDEKNYATIKHELRDNYKEFNNLLKRLSERYDIFKEYSNRLKYYDLYRFARLLGAFNDNQVERQKACEFIATEFEKEKIISFSLLPYNKSYLLVIAYFLLISDTKSKYFFISSSVAIL